MKVSNCTLIKGGPRFTKNLFECNVFNHTSRACLHEGGGPQVDEVAHLSI